MSAQIYNIENNIEAINKMSAPKVGFKRGAANAILNK